MDFPDIKPVAQAALRCAYPAAYAEFPESSGSCEAMKKELDSDFQDIVKVFALETAVSFIGDERFLESEFGAREALKELIAELKQHRHYLRPRKIRNTAYSHPYLED